MCARVFVSHIYYLFCDFMTHETIEAGSELFCYLFVSFILLFIFVLLYFDFFFILNKVEPKRRKVLCLFLFFFRNILRISSISKQIV